MTTPVPVTIAHGDGIGPEIMEATLAILDAAGAALKPETIEIGEKVYQRGQKNGIEESSWESLKRTRVFLKAPITTPQGGGFKSLNVTVRKSMGLFANVRPCVSYHPFVRTTQPVMDMVIVRENEEDLYSGIEYQQTDNVVQGLKIISATGSEKIARYAFEYARAAGRKKVTCISKDNIMKMTDGLFHRAFDRVALEYPEIETAHMIVDIGAAKIAAAPRLFDVVVTQNLYGDILSDIAAEVSGSVGLGGSSNIGTHGAMFEAIHGSAPDIAGRGIANPSGLLHAAIMMLLHIGQGDVAQSIHNAWLKTIEDGIHTGDIFNDGASKIKVGTQDFSRAVIERLGALPERLKPVSYSAEDSRQIHMANVSLPPRAEKKLVGVDVFLHWREGASGDAVARAVAGFSAGKLALASIDSRGLLMWPDCPTDIDGGDHWRCRFLGEATHADIVELLQKFEQAGFDFIKTENLYSFDGKNGFTVAAGQ